MENIKVLGIAGSPREASFNRRLLALAVKMLQEDGIDVEIFDVREQKIPIFDPDEESAHGFPPVVKQLRNKVREADAVLFASPEYNAGYTPLMKSIIDWASRTDPETNEPNLWAGKVGAIVSASPGALGGVRGLTALRQTLAHVEVLLIPEFTIVPHASAAFADDGSLVDQRSVAGLVRVLDRLVFVAQRLKPSV